MRGELVRNDFLPLISHDDQTLDLLQIRGDPKMEVRWYHETSELDPRNDSRFVIQYEAAKCSLTIANVGENDSGRYVCEASNRIGKVSSFARVLVVTDPKIIEADAKLRTR